MGKLEEYIGNIYIHPVLGEIEVLRVIPKSRTKLEVKVIDRGPGYNVSSKKYTGVKLSTGWMRGQNYDYGKIDEVHYKDLQKQQREET